MPTKKVSDLTALTTPAVGDLIPIVDISDTTDAATGTTKKITKDNLLSGDPSFDSVQLTGGTATEGTLSWNNTDKTAELIQEGVTHSVGRETLLRVYNDSGATITKGTAVMYSGVDAATGRVEISKMDGTDSDNARLYVGIAAEDISNASEGSVTKMGVIANIDTSSFSAGNTLWVSDATAGALTATEPGGASIGMSVAVVITSHATTGTIYVLPTSVDTHSSGSGGTKYMTASGAISNGDVVIINSNGTVSVVSGDAAGVSSEYEADATACNGVSCCFDATNNKVVLAYQDTTGTSYGTAVVGTIASEAITFGTPVVFESNTIYGTAICYDSDSGKVVIAYQLGATAGKGIVGTVSGTSISFGTATNFDATANIGWDEIDCCYDSNVSRVYIAYKDTGNSSYGTGVVGTVSGTSISFGTPVVFNSASTSAIGCCFDSTNNKVFTCYATASDGKGVVGTISGTSVSYGTVQSMSANAGSMDTTFDSTNGKVFAIYSDTGNSSYPTGVVGTISGTSVSFGTATVAESVASNLLKAAFDSANGKVVGGYNNNSTSMKMVAGTISGTSVSFDTAVTGNAGNMNRWGLTFDSNYGVIFAGFQDSADSNYLNTVFYRLSATTNVTATNVMGIAGEAIGDTATGLVYTDGGFANNQTSLTAATIYYVDTDGSLTTTDTGVMIGKALSATEVLIKTPSF